MGDKKMNETLATNMSLHFCYSALKGDNFTGIKIAKAITQKSPQQIIEFLLAKKG